MTDSVLLAMAETFADDLADHARLRIQRALLKAYCLGVGDAANVALKSTAHLEDNWRQGVADDILAILTDPEAKPWRWPSR